MINLKELPHLSPKAGFIGNLAETGVRTFVDIDNLMTHTLVAGATGSGKTVATQVLVEEALLKGKNVIVFDPTGQWTGFLRMCREKTMLKNYKKFGMKKEEAKAFDGKLKIVENLAEEINIKELVTGKESRITIFTLNKLKPEEIDLFIANTIREIFEANFEESKELKALIVYDEVHRLLPRFGGKGQGFVQIERGVREFRKWGIGLVLVSQVLSDFVGEIKANIGIEIQLRTRYEGDLDRIKKKYGEDISVSVIKESVGTGMLVYSEYNKGRPYFVSFRPILHQVSRLSDNELYKYPKYDEKIEYIKYQLEELKKKKVDVFDIEIELKLAESKLANGAFDMVEIYMSGLEARVKKEWKKFGRIPPAKKRKLVKEREIKNAIKKAEKEREKHIKRKKEKITIKDLESKIEELKDLMERANRNGKDIYIQNLELDRAISQLEMLKTIKDEESMMSLEDKLLSIEKDVMKKLSVKIRKPKKEKPVKHHKSKRKRKTYKFKRKKK